MSITKQHEAGDLLDPITECRVLETNFEIPCQFKPTHVIVNMRKAGYTAVCQYHRQKWLREMVQDARLSIILTLAEFEAQRTKGLYRDFDFPRRG